MTYEIKNILVPTDFSTTANNALEVAIAMANRHKADLHLMHIVTPQPLFDPMNIHMPLPDIEPALLNDSRENLERHKAAILKTNRLEITTHVEFGTVAGSISNYVINSQKDLVVMGTHGAGGWREYFIGSTAMATIRECSCPVLTIPPDFKKRTFDSVLYPIRNVEGVVEKYNYIKAIVEKNDAGIHLLGVALDNNKYEVDILINKLKEVQDAMFHENFSYEIHQCQNIAKKILEVAQKRKNDIIIINATLDKDWFKFFTGSFTQQIVNHSPVPVLSLKPALTPELEKQRENFFTQQTQYYHPLLLQTP